MPIRRLLRVLVAVMYVALQMTACQSQEEIKRQKYITEGILLYQRNCANCHQNNGKGLEALYPPLDKSNYLANKDSVLHTIRYGLQGPILINGKRYNRPMPANPQLSNLEIAEIATYIYNQWGNENSLITTEDVKRATGGQ